jgi:serine protease Do
MNTNSSPFITAGLVAALVTPLFAVEAPEDNAPPPASTAKPQAQLPEIKLQQEEKAAAVMPTAFLGIVSSDVPEVLAEHLDLKPGEGVIVRSLVPDGPAAKAGLAINDVITRVAGKAVGSPQDISEQVTAHKPGDAVELDLIHKGKETQLKVNLGSKPQEFAANEPQTVDPLQFDGIPKELAERIRKAVEGNLRGLDLQLEDAEAQIGPKMEEAMRELKLRMQGAIGQGFALPGDDADAKAQVQGGATIRMNDGNGSVEVKSADGSKEVTIRDQQDNVVWNGPWDTAQDKEAAPADVRKRVDSLNIDKDFKGAGLRLQMNQAEEPKN